MSVSFQDATDPPDRFRTHLGRVRAFNRQHCHSWCPDGRGSGMGSADRLATGSGTLTAVLPLCSFLLWTINLRSSMRRESRKIFHPIWQCGLSEWYLDTCLKTSGVAKSLNFYDNPPLNLLYQRNTKRVIKAKNDNLAVWRFQRPKKRLDNKKRNYFLDLKFGVTKAVLSPRRLYRGHPFSNQKANIF